MGIERDTKAVGSSIDRLSGRLSILAQSAASLGPALAPITVAAIPAIAGLTTQLGFAVAAGGSAILAFQGVGDALDAMNKAHLDPTTKNLEKAQKALEDLSPSAFNFVLQLRDMAPAFKEVRDAGAEGLFPWLSDSLDEIDSLLPRVASIVGEIAATTGELVNASAESLAGPEWEDFFAFVEREARPTLIRLGESIGNVAHGLAEMWIAFDPLSDDFQDGLVNATAAFDEWASSLSQTEGFAEFVRYIRETGPQVMETIGSIANALLQVAEAAAPLGGPVLQILEAIADVVAAIADSELGTPIFGAIAAMSALNLATTAWGRTKETAFGAGAVKQVQGFADALLNVDGAQRRATLSVTEFARAEEKRRTTLAKGFGAVAAAGAGYAALEAGIIGSNAALGASVGLMIGPWGAAAGGALGTLADMEAKGDGVARALEGINESLNAGELTKTTTALSKARDELAAFSGDITQFDTKFDPLAPFTQPVDSFRNFKNSVEDLFGESDIEEARAPLVALEDKLFETERAATGLAVALGAVNSMSVSGGDGGILGRTFDVPIITDVTVAVEDMEAALRSAAPAMQSLGITIDDLRGMSLTEQADAFARIRTEIVRLDSEPARIDSVADAVAALDDELTTTEESAKNLSDALSAILDPKIDLSRARDEWKQFLHDLGEDLDSVENPAIDAKEAQLDALRDKRGDATTDRARDAIDAQIKAAEKELERLREAGDIAGSRSLFDGSEGSRTNREVIRQGIEGINEALELEAANGAGPKRLKQVFNDMTGDLRTFATQAGISGEEFDRFTRKFLNPIKVAINTSGLTDAEREARRLEARLDRIARARVIHIESRLDRDGDGDPDFAGGGYTGPGGKYEPAGVVHRDEFVFSSEATRGNVGFLDSLHRHLRGYASGGYVGASVPARAVVASPGAGIDIDALAAAMLRARPLYGDVHISGDPTVFRQTLQDDDRMSQSDGVRRR